MVSKSDRPDINDQVAASIKNFSSRAKDDARQKGPIELSEFIQQKAALISAHFLLPAGSRMIDMGCDTGEVTFMLAQLNPRVDVIGVDHNAANIEYARKTYKLPNLTYRVSDISIPDFDDESIDAIINSNILHHVYSVSGYNEEEVTQLLEKQIQKLKPGGTMMIRDYMKPSDSEYVLLELPDTKSVGRNIDQLSDADLLIVFSQVARPLPGGGSEGFFIEEMKPRREGTRLFRLQHKWAIEFLHRKDPRSKWNTEIKEEYTFFTYQDYRREFARIGMRMTFSAPYWNPWVVRNYFKGRFQLYSEDDKPMNHPATNYFILAQRVMDKQSLVLEERRPSQKPVGDLQISMVRDKKSGVVHELVKRPGEFCDIIPFRITPDNRLVVYVRNGSPRPIVNAVMRGSHNLDGKKWSGHLVEPVMMSTEEMTRDMEANRRMIFDHVRNTLNLRPKSEGDWFVGDTYFPAPDRIEEAIEPVFVEVENPFRTTWPLRVEQGALFSEPGAIVELDGADIMLAAQVGLLPEPRLEMHVIELMTNFEIAFPRWIGDGLPKLPGQAVKTYEPEALLEELEATEFEKVTGEPVRIKPVKAVFVEEGKVGRTTRGLSAQDIEFIVTDDGIENIAVVLPISRDWDNNLLVALDPKIMPVPNRFGGDGATLNAPSFVLPKDVKTIDDAKAFIAAKFRVGVDQVVQLGESYFTHVGVTPQRIYPFTVASASEASSGSILRFTMIKKIANWARFKRIGKDTIKLIARLTMQSTSEGHGMAMQRENSYYQKEKPFTLSSEKVKADGKHIGVPSRVLGQRGRVDADQKSAKSMRELIAGLMLPRGPRRLTDSYAQAKVNVKEDAGIEKIDRNIAAVARTLFDNKQKKMETTTGEKTPPKTTKR